MIIVQVYFANLNHVMDIHTCIYTKAKQLRIIKLVHCCLA